MFHNLSVLHLIPSVGPRSFGVGPVALNLALEQLRLGCDVQIWSLDTPEDRLWASKCSGFPADLIKVFPTFGPRHWGYSPAMEHAIIGVQGKSFDIVHQHGIWAAISRATNVWRADISKPTLIALHGMLEAWALRRSVFKKMLASCAYERRNLHLATCLHACSQQEVAGFRDYGLANIVAVVPNGISERWLADKGNDSAFRQRNGIGKRDRVLLFLSRVSPVKGLLMLVEALSQVRSCLRDWVVVIAGADEFEHRSEVECAVIRYGLQQKVRFIGLQLDQAKADAFASADLFILPTKRENYGIVVAEALGKGVPVITTKGAPWQDIETHNCGWWTDISPEGIAQALKEATGKTREELSAMGENGRQLVSRNYTWQQSAEKTVALYNWLLGTEVQPEFAYTE